MMFQSIGNDSFQQYWGFRKVFFFFLKNVPYLHIYSEKPIGREMFALFYFLSLDLFSFSLVICAPIRTQNTTHKLCIHSIKKKKNTEFFIRLSAAHIFVENKNGYLGTFRVIESIYIFTGARMNKIWQALKCKKKPTYFPTPVHKFPMI